MITKRMLRPVVDISTSLTIVIKNHLNILANGYSGRLVTMSRFDRIGLSPGVFGSGSGPRAKVTVTF